jgi:hypothetical protein
LASAMAMPWPMPEVEPVTTAVLPLRDIAILFLRSMRYAVGVAAILPQSSSVAYVAPAPMCHQKPGCIVART